MAERGQIPPMVEKEIGAGGPGLIETRSAPKPAGLGLAAAAAGGMPATTGAAAGGSR